MSDLVTLRFSGGIGTLTLHRPDARNALSLDLLQAMLDRLKQCAADDACRVLVITGEGKSFCAGMDLKAVTSDQGLAAGLHAELLHALASVTLALRTLPAVTLAKVNGAAIGGGCGLACACDLAITHDDSKMGFPEVDLGVGPAVVAPWVVKKIGAGQARAVLLRGGLMSGKEAHAIGIVDHRVESREGLDAAADAIATRLASAGPAAMRATKELLNRLDGSTDESVLRRAADLSAQVLAMPQTQATLRAKFSQ